MKKKKLTEKEQFFVKYYIKTLNATEAAKKAKYSEKTAHSIGWENLRKPEIQEAIQEELNRVKKSCDVDIEYVIGGLKEVSGRCLQRVPVMVRDHEGSGLIQKTDEDGNGVWEFDSGGANKSLELLGKHLQLFTDKIKVEGGSFADLAAAAVEAAKREEAKKEPKFRVIKKKDG